jgi:hypothetical protein
VLEEAEQPLHYSEIAQLASARAGREIDERRAHSAAAEVGYLLGRGLYGTSRYLGFDTEALFLIAEEASALVIEGPNGRQWHARELAAAIPDENSWNATRPSKYVVDVALRLHSSLTRLGRMVWTAPGQELTASRVDLRQAIMAALQQARGPLRGIDLQQRLIAIRGINDWSNIACNDPVIRLGEGWWALNDRDVPITRAQQGELHNQIASLLHTSQVAIHVSELSQDLLGPLTPRMLLSLVGLDPRLDVGTGQYIYLREWRSPRRETVSSACTVVLRGNGLMNYEALYAAVVARVGRKCGRNEVSAALQGIEAVLDQNGCWSFDETVLWQDTEAA